MFCVSCDSLESTVKKKKKKYFLHALDVSIDFQPFSHTEATSLSFTSPLSIKVCKCAYCTVCDWWEWPHWALQWHLISEPNKLSFIKLNLSTITSTLSWGTQQHFGQLLCINIAVRDAPVSGIHKQVLTFVSHLWSLWFVTLHLDIVFPAVVSCWFTRAQLRHADLPAGQAPPVLLVSC